MPKSAAPRELGGHSPQRPAQVPRANTFGRIPPADLAGDSGHWGEQRSQYIFRTYDLNGDGFLDYGEMLHLVRHLRRGRKESEAVAEIELQARTLIEDIGAYVGVCVLLLLWRVCGTCICPDVTVLTRRAHGCRGQ